MKKYRYVGDDERIIVSASVTCNKGDVFESDVEINSQFVEEILDTDIEKGDET